MVKDFSLRIVPKVFEELLFETKQFRCILKRKYIIIKRFVVV